MNVINLLFGRRSASVARDRLHILLAHERSLSEAGSDLLTVLREEILSVVARHVEIDQDNVKVVSKRGQNVSTLVIDIEIPSGARMRLAVGM